MAKVLMPDVREAIWMQLLNSARWERYYGALASYHVRLERTIRFVLFASAVGAIVAFVDRLPSEFAGAFGVLVGLTVVLDAVLHPGRSAVVYGLIRDECQRHKNELDRLWRRSHLLEREEAEERLAVLTNTLMAVTARDQGPTRERVNRAATAAVFAEARTGRVS